MTKKKKKKQSDININILFLSQIIVEIKCEECLNEQSIRRIK